MEAKWVVPDNPTEPGAFFSPWFGIESSDNLNLIQPVNPWEGYSWSFYNEYFQWEPEYNRNSASFNTKAGHTLFGSVTYVASNQSYNVYHSDLNTGASVSFSIPVQTGPDGNPKKFNIAYFVMEKSQWQCAQYPPNNQVTFTDIKVEYDGAAVQPKWTTAFVDDNCNCRAHITNETSIQITWDSGAEANPLLTAKQPMLLGAPAPRSLHAHKA
ncbi:unnamed protein product [Symbiodinium sp. KB8]|nr:unnamed protein product [Symbiodinium sp. KB8]